MWLMVYKESRGPKHRLGNKYRERYGEDTENKRPRKTKEIKQTQHSTGGLGVVDMWRLRASTWQHLSGW